MNFDEIKQFKHLKKAYFEIVDGQLVNEAAFVFYSGCKFMQMEIIGFTSDEISELEIGKDTIVYGGVGTMLEVFKKMNVPVPSALDIPVSLENYVGRKIYYSTLEQIMLADIDYPVFIKPADSAKLFNGSVVSSKSEMETFLVYNKLEKRDIPIMVSEVVNFISEYRVFILNGKILDCRKYKGDVWQKVPYFKKICAAINDYSSAPVAYTLDFGITHNYSTVLIEANDAYSLGTYGLDPYHYMRMIMSRWLEITANFSV